MLLVAELERDRGVLRLQGVEEPGHHGGNLGLAHVVGVAHHAPRQGEVAQGGEISKHKDNLREI